MLAQPLTNHQGALGVAQQQWLDRRESTPGAELTLVIHRANGDRDEAAVLCRLDTEEELSVYSAGGVLQRFAQDFLESRAA